MSFVHVNIFTCYTSINLTVRLVQFIQLGFMFSWKQVTSILSNTYLTEFPKNLEKIKQFESVKVLSKTTISS